MTIIMTNYREYNNIIILEYNNPNNYKKIKCD